MSLQKSGTANVCAKSCAAGRMLVEIVHIKKFVGTIRESAQRSMTKNDRIFNGWKEIKNKLKKTGGY
jgi:hypothetical protein